MITAERDPRKMQIAVGALILGMIATVATSLIMGWRLVPGLFGEWLGVIAGLISTPFLLEGSFAILGLVTVIALNHWRLKREGDEFVYLEQVKGPDVPKDLPDHAKWALYREKPLPGAELSLLEQAEGAVAIGDFESAAGLLAAMGPAEFSQDGVLDLRLAMAEESGKPELAARLRQEIAGRGIPADRSDG